jgi:3-isopropylmalate/(R)-2-methylmalate dehydratase small subunit
VFTVDLDAKTITRPQGERIRFNIDDFRRDCLLNGLDEIGLTLQKVDKIDAFEAAQRQQQPWLYA